MNRHKSLIAALAALLVVFGVVTRTSAVNGGSIAFNGTDQYVSLPGSTDWAVGTGDFTVEWFQYQTSFSSSWPRIFTVGAYPASIGVSIESGTMYVWLAGSWRLYASTGSISNQWVHFAVSRSGGTLRIFKNGTQLASGSDSSNVTNSSTPLYVGSEATNGTYFGGLITNFHFVKGTALYTSAFTPSGPITRVANTKLLLNAETSASLLSDSSALSRSVSSVGSPTFNWGTPFPWTGGGSATSVPATQPPATTTTTTTTTTSTTVPPTTVAPTTTAAPTTTVVPVTTTTPVATTTAPTAAAGGTSPVATTPTVSSPTTTMRPTATTVTPANSAPSGAPSTTSTTSTTTSTTTTTLPPVPSGEEIPAVPEGQAAAVIGGKQASVEISRLDNELVLTVGTVKAVIGSQSTDGDRRPLSADGGMSLQPGGTISVRMEGLESESEIEGLLYSEPTRLGTALANDAGRVDHSFNVPSALSSGSHRFVVRLVDADGNNIDLAMGVVNTDGDGGGIGLAAIVLVVLGLGVAAALFLPAVLRKRRDVNSL